MSTSPFAGYSNGKDNSEPFDDKMHQIRELLFGEFKRSSDQRLALIEARVRELEQGIHRKLDSIQERLDALNGTVANDRRRAFDELSQRFTELGEQVARIGRGDEKWREE
ncbi:MAG: hypothetical protein ACK5JT_09815 [Hyphomicrobiaceae bacterium]